jgi:hypothetical protein
VTTLSELEPVTFFCTHDGCDWEALTSDEAWLMSQYAAHLAADHKPAPAAIRPELIARARAAAIPASVEQINAYLAASDAHAAAVGAYSPHSYMLGVCQSLLNRLCDAAEVPAPAMPAAPAAGTGMSAHLSPGSEVRYGGDLPEDWGHDGLVTAVEPEAAGGAIVTVDFSGGRGLRVQDILASELSFSPEDAQHHFDGDDCG